MAKERKDNEQFVADLMAFGNPLKQVFIMEAIRRYANECAAMDPAEFDNALLSGAAWVGVAKEIKAAMDARLGDDIAELHTLNCQPAPTEDDSPVEVPNLDAMERDDLFAFAARHRTGRFDFMLFPAGVGRLRERTKATQLLAKYASIKHTAMGMREEGLINTALQVEKDCELIYSQLPTWARW